MLAPKLRVTDRPYQDPRSLLTSVEEQCAFLAKAPKLDVLAKFLRLLESHVTWATGALLVFLAAFIPPLVHPQNLAANQLPLIVSRVQLFGVAGLKQQSAFTVFDQFAVASDIRGECRPKVSDRNYLDILSYIFKINGYRAGPSELTPDLLGRVMFVGKSGPQSIPDGALVITAGCLSQDQDGTWILDSATEPVRTREEITSTPAELKRSSRTVSPIFSQNSSLGLYTGQLLSPGPFGLFVLAKLVQ